MDSYGIELRHPRREGRSKAQIGKKGYSNHRFIVGAKFCPIVNQDGLICDWNYGDANLHDTEFHPLIEKFKDKMHLFGDSGFHKSVKRGGDPENLTICERGQKNEGMLVRLSFRCLRAFCISKDCVVESGIPWSHGSVLPWRLTICSWDGVGGPTSASRILPSDD